MNNPIQPCPESPNCVSTLDSDKVHGMSPISIDLSLNSFKEKVKKVMAGRPRARLVSENENYLHYVETSRFFKFKDDVEFYFDHDQNLLHFKSASRLGYGDLGVNRKRMMSIVKEFKEGL